MKCISIALTAFASILAVGGSAGAQQAGQKTEAHETVTVYAPFVVRHAPYGPSRGTPEPLELITVNRPVSFSDLDLKNATDQQTLETRVKQAAKDACQQLEHRFPKTVYIPVPADQDCEKNAVDEAMIMVRALTNAANAS